MNDPNLALLNAFQAALSTLSVGSKSIKVYPAIAPLKNVPEKYVLLTTQTRTDNETKCGTWWECEISTDIVTRYPNGTGNINFAMNIGQSISAIVQDQILTLSGFNIRQRKQQPPQTLALQTPNEDIYRYILTFYYKINSA